MLGGGELFISPVETLGRNLQLSFPVWYFLHISWIQALGLGVPLRLMGRAAKLGQAPELLSAPAGLLPIVILEYSFSFPVLSFDYCAIYILCYYDYAICTRICYFINKSGASFTAVMPLIVRRTYFRDICDV